MLLFTYTFGAEGGLVSKNKNFLYGCINVVYWCVVGYCSC